MRAPSVALLVLATGCPDYGFSDHRDDPEPLSILLIEPDPLYFGEVAQESRAQESLTLSNLGDASLLIEGLQVRGSATFSVEDEGFQAWIAPGESLELPVYYEPGTDLDEGSLEITSDDLYGPIHEVQLEGVGLFPELVVDPDPYDFGEVVILCGWEKTFTLQNVGQALLRITGIAHSGDGFELTDVPPLPIEIEPEQSAELTLLFNPELTGQTTGSLVFETNEPWVTESSEQTGEGIDPNTIVESWRQPDGPWEMSDILFYVDQSGSMGNDQANLSSNFGQFIGTLDEYISDYQIMVSTKDDGCHNGSIITPETTNADTVFSSAVRGSGGGDTERGLTIAREALERTGSGQCNEGFVRDGAKVMPILVSDEPEQSRSTWTDMVEEIVALAPTASISAIAGPVPGGCSTAGAGYGYYEASVATGGLFFSICDSDWGSNLQDLAVLATAAPFEVFPLTGRPVRVDSIVVSVDEVQNHDWIWDEEDNAVVFPSELIPEPLSWVEISYDLGCDG
jgi:hypothetical protein